MAFFPCVFSRFGWLQAGALGHTARMNRVLRTLTISAVLLMPAALAQSETTTAQQHAATQSATDWGWLGLAGLLGLMGLAGRKYTETYTTNTTRP